MSRFAVVVFVLSLLFLPLQVQGLLLPCSSRVFCSGEILHAVQTAKIFNDSKTFVDMPLKYNVDETLAAFGSINAGNATDLKHFVETYFDQVESDLSRWTPSDWTDSPLFLSHIVDMEYRQWAQWLNKVWLSLGRQVDVDVSTHFDRHSLIPVPKPFIVPGGRFREFYYWDSFWIIQGLLVCNMTETVANILINFSYLVDRYGMVPNGGRVYYSRRSQPPLLTLMVWEYYQQTRNLSVVTDILPNLKREHQFWITNRTVDVVDQTFGQSHQLVRYRAASDTPRPESYREDVMTVNGLQPDEAGQLYREIASAAESGWDFSTRWMSHSGDHANSLQSMRTSHIIPVDLNAILCQVEITLSQLCSLVDDKDGADFYASLAANRAKAIEYVLWNETAGIWQDFDADSRQQIEIFYLSGLVPLATRCYNQQMTGNVTRARNVVAAVQSLGILSYAGGVPTSRIKSGQQWDFPNAWPPLQWFAIVGMLNVNDSSVRQVAHNLMNKWIQTNWRAWKQTGHMYEKYNATNEGVPGGGGEYNVQTGFGWTNGIILFFLHRFGNSLVHDMLPRPERGNESHWKGAVIGVVVAVVAIVITFIICYYGRRIYLKGQYRYRIRTGMEIDDSSVLIN